jgi:hypothetical protein
MTLIKFVTAGVTDFLLVLYGSSDYWEFELTWVQTTEVPLYVTTKLHGYNMLHVKRKSSHFP